MEASLGSHDAGTGAKPTLQGFLEKWIEFEAKLRSIFAQLKRRNYTGPLSPSLLRELKVFSNVDDLHIVETLRRLRNQIVHGTDAPESDIVDAEKEISRLLNSLEGQYSIAPRRMPRSSSVRLQRGSKQS
jgi:hypothetical protein